MKVRIARSARQDLEKIGDWIARDSPRRALTFVEELRERCDALGKYPHAFPIVPRYEQSGLRRRVFGDYLIFYVIRDEEVLVLRILHGSRDYEALLFPDGATDPEP